MPEQETRRPSALGSTRQPIFISGWRDYSLCTDPDVDMYPNGNKHREQDRLINSYCALCPVRESCLADVLIFETKKNGSSIPSSGVAGGRTAKARDQMRETPQRVEAVQRLVAARRKAQERAVRQDPTLLIEFARAARQARNAARSLYKELTLYRASRGRSLPPGPRTASDPRTAR